MSNHHINECEEKLKQCEHKRNKLKEGITGMFLEIMEIEYPKPKASEEDYQLLGQNIVRKIREIYPDTNEIV